MGTGAGGWVDMVVWGLVENPFGLLHFFLSSEMGSKVALKGWGRGNSHSLFFFDI